MEQDISASVRCLGVNVFELSQEALGAVERCPGVHTPRAMGLPQHVGGHGDVPQVPEDTRAQSVDRTF